MDLTCVDVTTILGAVAAVVRAIEELVKLIMSALEALRA